LPAKRSQPAAPVNGAIRDRIKEFRRVPSAELHDNPRNWRTHPYEQSKAMSEMLDGIGIADVVVAYHSEREGGKLVLIDGHERKSHEADWPTVILDVTDAEADQLLATMDPLAGLAERNDALLDELLDDVRFGTPALADLLQGLSMHDGPEPDPDPDPPGDEPEFAGPKEMELLPFEHYDTVVLLFDRSTDWLAACDLLGLSDVKFSTREGKARRAGRGRVVDGKRVLEMLRRT
jgi:hypothetical protein